MSNRREILTILENADIMAARAFWKRFPGMPQPKNDREIELVIHITRTKAHDVAFKHRAYSHSWLVANGYQSLLPDELRPKAERLYPVIADAVGISVNSKYPVVQREVRGAMEDVVENAYADRKTDPTYIKPRMFEARQKAVKRLFG